MTAVLAFAALVVVGWFAVGSAWNVRKGGALMRWMQGGLPRLGPRATVRWLGTTSVELGIAAAAAPFERVQLVLALEPRDVPWLWGFGRWRGRRDLLIVRAQLRRAPAAELDVFDPAGWPNRSRLGRASAEGWSVRAPSRPGDLVACYRAPSGLAAGDDLLGLAARAELGVRRLALRRTEPHLELHLELPRLARPAVAYFDALRALGERAASVAGAR